MINEVIVNIMINTQYKQGRIEGNILFNDALNAIYGYMASYIW